MERTHINLLQYIAGVTPLFWVMIALAAAIGIGEIGLLALAVRQRQSGRLAIAAVVGPVLLVGAIVAAIRIGHVTLLRGLAANDPVEAIKLVVAGLEGFLNAMPVGLLLLGPIVGLATIAACLHASAALKIPARPLVIMSLLFVGAGLGPILLGALRYATQLTKVFSVVAGVDPAMKEVMVTTGIEETRVDFDRSLIIGAVGFGAALIFAMVTVTGAQFRSRPGRVGWRWPVVCLIVAALLYAAAEPLRAENATPWPASPSAALNINRVATPDVDGPDAIPRAEVVTVSDKLLLVDGGPRNTVELRDALVTMRNNYNLLHPAEETDESLVIVCPPETRTEALIEVLRFAKALEYRRPAFAFGKETFIERPVLGRLRRWQWTAAKALIPGVGPETPTPIVTLTVGDHPNCGAVARAVAAIRRNGKIAGLAF